jgi:hypothetical protein
METIISVVSDNSAIRDVMTAELSSALSSLEDVSLERSDRSSKNQKVARLGVLELLATFVTSAAAIQLALALRDFVTRQSIELRLVSAEGDVLLISATGGDPESISDIVGFLTEQHKKESFHNDLSLRNSSLSDTDNSDLPA